LKASGQTDVAGAGTNHVRVTNGRERHGITYNREIQRRFRTHALDFDRYRFTQPAANILGNLFAGPILRVLPINFQNAIAILETELRSRSPLNGRLHVNAVAMLHDRDADAVEARILVLF